MINQTTPSGEIKLLKASLTPEEFGAIRWAAARSGRPALPLADFFRRALFNEVRAVIRQEIEHGHPIPANVAHLIASVGKPPTHPA